MKELWKSGQRNMCLPTKINDSYNYLSFSLYDLDPIDLGQRYYCSLSKLQKDLEKSGLSYLIIIEVTGRLFYAITNKTFGRLCTVYFKDGVYTPLKELVNNFEQYRVPGAYHHSTVAKDKYLNYYDDKIFVGQKMQKLYYDIMCKGLKNRFMLRVDAKTLNEKQVKDYDIDGSEDRCFAIILKKFNCNQKHLPRSNMSISQLTKRLNETNDKICVFYSDTNITNAYFNDGNEGEMKYIFCLKGDIVNCKKFLPYLTLPSNFSKIQFCHKIAHELLDNKNGKEITLLEALDYAKLILNIPLQYDNDPYHILRRTMYHKKEPISLSLTQWRVYSCINKLLCEKLGFKRIILNFHYNCNINNKAMNKFLKYCKGFKLVINLSDYELKIAEKVAFPLTLSKEEASDHFDHMFHNSVAHKTLNIKTDLRQQPTTYEEVKVKVEDPNLISAHIEMKARMALRNYDRIQDKGFLERLNKVRSLFAEKNNAQNYFDDDFLFIKYQMNLISAIRNRVVWTVKGNNLNENIMIRFFYSSNYWQLKQNDMPFFKTLFEEYCSMFKEEDAPFIEKYLDIDLNNYRKVKKVEVHEFDIRKTEVTKNNNNIIKNRFLVNNELNNLFGKNRYEELNWDNEYLQDIYRIKDPVLFKTIKRERETMQFLDIGIRNAARKRLQKAMQKRNVKLNRLYYKGNKVNLKNTGAPAVELAIVNAPSTAKNEIVPYKVSKSTIMVERTPQKRQVRPVMRNHYRYLRMELARVCKTSVPVLDPKIFEYGKIITNNEVKVKNRVKKTIAFLLKE